MGSVAQCMHTVLWAFVGAETVYAEWFPTVSRIHRLLTCHHSTVRTADQHGSRTKPKGQILNFSLGKRANQGSVVSAESLICPARQRCGAPHWQPLTSHFTWPRCSYQHFQDSCSVSWANYWRIPGMKALQTAQGFMTSTPGLSWHPVLAAASYLSSTAGVLFEAISNQCLLEVHTTLKLVPELTSY